VASDPAIDQECVEGYLYVAAPRRLLLLRRPPDRGSIWAVVSGKVEPTDPDLASALRREVAEETGFVQVRRMFPLDWEVVFEGPTGGRWRLHGFGVELPVPAVPRLSPEHVAAEWVPFDEAERRLHYPDNRDAVGRLREALTADARLPVAGDGGPRGGSP
jgi:8-oxo-dGTP pyrophosphatase MutT (NUDIX family)